MLCRHRAQADQKAHPCRAARRCGGVHRSWTGGRVSGAAHRSTTALPLVLGSLLHRHPGGRPVRHAGVGVLCWCCVMAVVEPCMTLGAWCGVHMPESSFTHPHAAKATILLSDAVLSERCVACAVRRRPLGIPGPQSSAACAPGAGPHTHLCWLHCVDPRHSKHHGEHASAYRGSMHTSCLASPARTASASSCNQKYGRVR